MDDKLLYGIDWGNEKDFSCTTVVCGNCRSVLSLNYSNTKEECNTMVFNLSFRKTIHRTVKT